MRAIRFHEFGTEDVLQLEELEDPRPGPGQLVVAVRAVAVNRIDLDIRSGVSGPVSLPHTLGREFAGVVVDAPCDSEFRANDRVWIRNRVPCGSCSWCIGGADNLCATSLWFGINVPGGYAEFVAVPVSAVVRLPDNVTFSDAAATQVSFGAAVHSLIGRAGLRVGQSVLILGGASSVGTAAIQVAKMSGASAVIATLHGKAKAEKIQGLGASLTLDQADEHLSEHVLAATQGLGVDIVLDLLGGPMLDQGLASLAPTGCAVSVGTVTGRHATVNLPRLSGNELRVIGSKNSTLAEAEWAMELLAQARIAPVVDAVLPLARAADAHRLLNARLIVGKVVLEA